MKKILTAAICLAAFASCKKENPSNTITPKKEVTKVNYHQDNPAPGTLSGVYVNLMPDGNYTTTYGGGIGFGTTFPYPTVVESGMQGTLWSNGAQGSNYFNNNLLSFNSNGPYFTALFGTYAGVITTNTHQAINAYNTAFNEYLNFATSQNGQPKYVTLPQYSDFAGQQGASSDGIITITGQFIVDANSPTHVSIVPMSTIPTVPDLPPTLPTVY